MITITVLGLLLARSLALRGLGSADLAQQLADRAARHAELRPRTQRDGAMRFPSPRSTSASLASEPASQRAERHRETRFSDFTDQVQQLQEQQCSRGNLDTDSALKWSVEHARRVCHQNEASRMNTCVLFLSLLSTFTEMIFRFLNE